MRLELVAKNIGTEVIFPMWRDLKATIIGFSLNRNGSLDCAIVGHQWGEGFNHGFEPMTDLLDTVIDSFSGYEVNETLASKFAYGAFFPVNNDCIVCKPIVCPDQKCSLCGKPSPHSNPNQDERFVCIWCSVDEDLDEELPHTD